jgi:hypothetical protein
MRVIPGLWQRLKASSGPPEQNKEQRSDLEVFNRLRKELGMADWSAPKKYN